MVAYHWDLEPAGGSVILSPHVHVGKDLPNPGMPPRDRDLLESIAAAHLPTGPIPFSDVLRMVVRDFGVEPVRHPGETAAAARDAAEHSFAEAGAALRASFAWWSGDEDA